MERITNRKMPIILSFHLSSYLLFSYYYDFQLVCEDEFYVKMAREINKKMSTIIFEKIQTKFSCFFKEFTQHQKNLLTSNLQCQVFLPNEIVSCSSKSSSGIYFIMSGSVHLKRPPPKDETPESQPDKGQRGR